MVAGAGFEPTTFGLWALYFSHITRRIKAFSPRTQINYYLIIIVCVHISYTVLPSI